VYALQIADSLADASAEKAEEPAPDDYSASNRGPVVSAVVRPEGRANTKPNGGSDHNMLRVAMIHPRRLVGWSGISTLGWQPPRRSTSMKLRQGCVIRTE
jgi:hypothetical protein